MLKFVDAYIALVVAVNESQSEETHRVADARRQGWLDCYRLFGDGYGYLLMEADMHYLTEGVERPMCGGVWLDWEPTP